MTEAFPWTGRLCVVTGGCGFIGSHLCEALLEAGARVRVLDDLSSGREENLRGVRGRVDLRRGDVRDPRAVAPALDGADTVFHQAALVSVADSVERPRECFDINEAGTLTVLEAARGAGVRRVVFAGSAAAYGNDPGLPKREDMPARPLSPYAAAKVAAEGWMRAFAGLYGVETVVLRYFNVYGPRQNPSSPYSGVVSRFVDALRAGRPPVIFGDGKQTRDFVFVRDVARANLLAAARGTVGRGEILNIAAGRAVSLLDLAGILERISGRVLPPLFEPARPGDVRHSAADIGRARRQLGFEPASGLEQGLRALWEDPGWNPPRS